MKRLAILAAVVFGPAAHAAPPDAPPIPEFPPGAQLAPTLPQVPRPVLNGTDLKQGEAGRAEIPIPQPPTRHHIRPTVKVEPGPDSIPAGLPARGPNGGTGTATLPVPGTPTLPPPPVPDTPAPPAPAAPTCGPEGCAAGHRNAWHRFTGFLFYRQSSVYFGLHPTPYVGPYHTLFPCEERAPCGPAGCAAAGHPAPAVGQAPAPEPGPAGGATSTRPSLGWRLFNRGGAVKPERGWATAGETIPGYRLATPETPAVTGERYPTPPAVGTSYKVPTGQR
jgi:hypothetical protein